MRNLRRNCRKDHTLPHFRQYPESPAALKEASRRLYEAAVVSRAAVTAAAAALAVGPAHAAAVVPAAAAP